MQAYVLELPWTGCACLRANMGKALFVLVPCVSKSYRLLSATACHHMQLVAMQAVEIAVATVLVYVVCDDSTYCECSAC